MKKIFALFLTMCAILSCSQFEEPTAEVECTAPRTRSGGGNQTFNIIPNPYALDVMQAVYDDNGVDVMLEPTDLYVRIMPQGNLRV